MEQGKWRIWNLSISILIFLTAYNVVVTIRLVYFASCEHNANEPIEIEVPDCIIKNPQPVPKNRSLTHEVAEALNKLQSKQHYHLNLNLGIGRYDNKLVYKLYDNILVGDKYVELSGQYRTCLATQSSLEKIASLIESSLYWAGPISLAAFAGNERELDRLLLYIIYLRKCNARIRERVAFHLAIIKDKGPKKFFIDEERLEKMDCENPMGVLHGLTRDITKRDANDVGSLVGIKRNSALHQWRYKLPYPQNLLRNLARKNCHTKYVFLTDVDIIPSRGMAGYLNVFLDDVKCEGKCAYVVPTYELDERVLFPPNKTDLIRMANKGLARPFHHKVFIFNQYATNFSRWQNYTDADDKIRISHPVTNFEFLYEPFYIATDDVPPHDERFVGYGYTRNSQVYEMFVAGYEFFVLSPIFTCHWGLQVKKTRPPWREHQNNQNRRQFDQFKKEIFTKYNRDPLNMMGAKNG